MPLLIGCEVLLSSLIGCEVLLSSLIGCEVLLLIGCIEKKRQDKLVQAQTQASVQPLNMCVKTAPRFESLDP